MADLRSRWCSRVPLRLSGTGVTVPDEHGPEIGFACRSPGDRHGGRSPGVLSCDFACTGPHASSGAPVGWSLAVPVSLCHGPRPAVSHSGTGPHNHRGPTARQRDGPRGGLSRGPLRGALLSISWATDWRPRHPPTNRSRRSGAPPRIGGARCVRAEAVEVSLRAGQYVGDSFDPSPASRCYGGTPPLLYLRFIPVHYGSGCRFPVHRGAEIRYIEVPVFLVMGRIPDLPISGTSRRFPVPREGWISFLPVRRDGPGSRPPHDLPVAGYWWPQGAGEGIPHRFLMPLRLGRAHRREAACPCRGRVRQLRPVGGLPQGKHHASPARQCSPHTATPLRISPAFFQGTRQLVANELLRGVRERYIQIGGQPKSLAHRPELVWPVAWSIDDIGSYRATHVGSAAHRTRKRRNIAAHRRLT